MVADLIRDSVFGQTVNWATKGKVFPYPEQRPDYVVPERYLARASSNEARNSRSSGLTHPQASREANGGRGSVDAATLVNAEGHVKRTYQTEQEKHDQQLDEKRNEEGLTEQQLELQEARRARDEEEGNQEEQDKRAQEAQDKHPGTANPRRAHNDALHEKYQYLVAFEEGDPENPKNWSTRKRSFVAGQISLLTTVVYIGSAIYTPSSMGIMEEYGVAQVVATLGLTLFILGYGIGPMLWSPLQETAHLGRNPVYIFTLFCFCILQIPILLPTNLTCILIFRFLTGFFGSPALATGGASMADIYSMTHLPYAMAVWAVGAVCGPILGPVVGGFAAQHMNWKWTILELLWLAGFGLAIFVFFLPETYSPTILKRRAERLRKITGNDLIKTHEELHAQDEPGLLKTGTKQVILAFKLCAEPAVMFSNLYIGLIYAIFYLWFEAFPIVFAEYHGMSLSISQLPFLAFFVTGAITLTGYCLYQKYRLIPRLVATNFTLAPEWRLELAVFAAPMIWVSLFIFGWTGNSSETHWIGPTIGAALYFPGIFCIFQCILIYLQQAYPTVSASILAGNDLFRSSMAAGFPLFGAPMFHNLGVGPACSLLAGLNILLFPPLIFLWKYGDRLRKRSKYGAA
ncbi:hypothetical protein JCM6882_000062 [Rhodosporidiobolus microsporus]